MQNSEQIHKLLLIHISFAASIFIYIFFCLQIVLLFFRGHADFYPNRGTNPQPGCGTLDILTLASCSHYRAPLYFAESILLPESFACSMCEGLLDILPTAASCLLKIKKNFGEQTVFMGENVNHL